MSPRLVFFESQDPLGPATAQLGTLAIDDDQVVIPESPEPFWEHLGQDLDQVVAAAPPPIPALSWDEPEATVVAVEEPFLPDPNWVVEGGFSIDDLPMPDLEQAAELPIVAEAQPFWEHLGADLDQVIASAPPVVPSLSWDDAQELEIAGETGFFENLGQDLDQAIVVPALAWDDVQDVLPAQEDGFFEHLGADLDQVGVSAPPVVPSLSWDDHQDLEAATADPFWESLGQDLDQVVVFVPPPVPSLDWMESEQPLLVEIPVVFFEHLGVDLDQAVATDYVYTPPAQDDGVWALQRDSAWVFGHD